MEENKSLELKVGLFILIGTVAIMTTMILLGADKAFFSQYMRLHARFDQVQGLAKGSVVSLSGVVVGNVDQIDFQNNERLLDVQLKIDKAFQNKITLGSKVDIRTQGALGDKFVFITPGPLSNKPLNDGDQIDIDKSSDIISVIGQRASEAEKIFDIINNIHLITSEFAQNHQISNIISNLSSASKNLDATSDATKKMALSFQSSKLDKNLAESLDKLNLILGKIEKGQGTLGALINDPTLHSQILGLLGGSSRKNHLKNIMRTSIEESEKH